MSDATKAPPRNTICAGCIRKASLIRHGEALCAGCAGKTADAVIRSLRAERDWLFARRAELETLVEDQRQIILRYREQTRWIPVEERLPEPTRYVLISTGRGTYIGYQEDGYWSISNGFTDARPSHWMPLPEPPETAE